MMETDMFLWDRFNLVVVANYNNVVNMQTFSNNF